MDENLYLTILYDLYEKLLTETQKEYFKLYYFENLTMDEIAENLNISKNAVFKSINTTTNKLKELEKKLGIYQNNKKIEEILHSNDINYIKKEIEKIIQ